MNSDKRWLTAFCPFYGCLSGVLCSWPIRLLAVQGPSLSPVGNPALFLFFVISSCKNKQKPWSRWSSTDGIFHFSQAFPEQVQEAREEVMKNLQRAIRWADGISRLLLVQEIWVISTFGLQTQKWKTPYFSGPTWSWSKTILWGR